MSGGETPRLEDLLRDAMQSAVNGIHVALPAQVVVYNPATQRVSVKPAVKLRTSSEPDEVTGLIPTRSMPMIPDVPVVFPTGGGYALVHPLVAGDWVLLVIGSHTMAEWLTTGTVEAEPLTGRRHNLADAFAIPGAVPVTQPRLNAVTGGTDLLMGRQDGTTEVAVGATDVRLGTRAAVNPVALSIANEANWGLFDAWATTVQAMLAGLGLPITPPWSSHTNTAATKVKAI
jgi:hypothetical protein